MKVSLRSTWKFLKARKLAFKKLKKKYHNKAIYYDICMSGKGKLQDKKIKAISYDIYSTRDNIDVTYEKINTYGLNTLIEMNNNGIITNILDNAIARKDVKIIEQLQKISILMKRDILKLIKFHYSNGIDYSDAIVPFITNLDENDIKWLIDNELHNVIEKCVGYFLKSNSTGFKVILDNEADLRLEKKYLSQEICEQVKTEIEKKIPKSKKINELIDGKKYDLIIDGGNVIHAIDGKVTEASFKFLELMIMTCKKKFKNILLVIHKSHWKHNIELEQVISKTKIDYYLTPPTYYDDLFIMLFFVLNSSCHQ